MLTILEQFLELAGSKLEVSFFRDGPECEAVPYGALAEGACDVSAYLGSLGIPPKSRVAVLLETGPEFYHAFFGIQLAGCIPVALAPPQQLAALESWIERTAGILQRANCRAVLTSAKFYSILGRPVLSARIMHGAILADQIGKTRAVAADFELPRPNDIAFLQFSSGTTGAPKPVAISFANLAANLESILSGLPLPRSELRAVSWLPLYHDMGLVGMLMGAIAARVPLCLIRPDHFVAKPLRWLKAIQHTGANITVAPNFAFGLCAKRIQENETEGLDLSALKIALCGAETVHTATLAAFARRFARHGFDSSILIPVYGLAEATLAVSFAAPGRGPESIAVDQQRLIRDGVAEPASEGIAIASVGRPLSGVRVEVRDEQGNALPDLAVGRLWVQSASVMTGYFNMESATKAAIVGGWLDTGDLAFLKAGEIYLCGRAKDTIVIRGQNFDPVLLEQELGELQGIRTGRVAAFGCSDPALATDCLVIAAELREESMDEQFLAALKDAISRCIARSFGLKVDHVQLLPAGALPRTPSGKLCRAEARRRFMAGELHGSQLQFAYLKGGREMLLGNGAHVINRVRGGLRRLAGTESATA